MGSASLFVLAWLEWKWKHPCSQELDTRAAVHGALELFEPIDLAFRLTAAPRLRDGVPHGLDVAHQRSCELLHRGKARSSGVIKETVKLAWVGALQKTAEPHRQPPHHDKARRGFLQSAHLSGLWRRQRRRRLHAERGGNHGRDLPACRRINGRGFPERLNLCWLWRRWRLTRRALAPSRQQPLKVGEAADISAISDVMKEPATQSDGNDMP